MHRRQFLSHALQSALAGVSVCGLSGCGTFIHPERNGLPHSDELDWKIAALDGLGLLLFFVPGVIAFAVDFYTGAIYLPVWQTYPGYGAVPQAPVGAAPQYYLPPPPVYYPAPAPAAQPVPGPIQAPAVPPYLGLKGVVVPREQLQPPYLAQVVEKHVGRPISLDDSAARLSELARIDQFDEQVNRHRADRNFGHSVRSFFAQLAHA